MTSTFHDNLTAAHDILSRVLTLMDTIDGDGRNLEGRMVDGYRGHPKAASYDSDRVTASGTSDPTGNAAIQRRNMAETDHKLVRARSRDLLELVYGMEKVAASYTPRPATDKERREVDGANDPGCTSCARTEVRQGLARWEPVHKDKLCRFCYQYRRDTGLCPTEAQLYAHHSGQRVKRPA